ncbi:hypothetical protein M378DRAFT_155399 [Amanita muscaria Koide BX008]|uniref:Seipin n=1 Tax=Amanita muscaria (strain Koide BX008) TaxID=946122 RepID=A0A0C2XQ69_AMAMK|nr:hypothetical protein M378DRAFT_155399 [Amanita muscaria Koide BX008]
MARTDDDDDAKPIGDVRYATGDEGSAGLSFSELYRALIASGVDTLRAFAPHIIPLFVCALLIPLVVAVSVFAGWLVWKHASVSWEAPLYLQYGDASQPYARLLLPSLVAQQRYDISVQLVVPVSESNVALGNFMTSLTLSTPANKTLITVRRPALILPSGSSLFTTKPSVVTVDLQLLKAYLPGTSKLIATLELGRRDSWTSLGKGEGREVSVLSAHIRGAIVHHGIRGIVARFPLISAVLSTIGFLALLSVTLGACILPSILRQRDRVGPIIEAGSNNATEDQRSTTSEDYNSDRDNRSLRRSRSSSTHEEVKVESEAESIPPTRGQPEPLRRRRSRRTERQSDTDS